MPFASRLPYTLVRRVAEGGMGVVFEAEQRAADGSRNHFALKFLRDSLASQPAFLDNFRGEAVLASSLRHPNVVRTDGLGQSQGRSFIAMEFVRGMNLEEFLVRHRVARRGVSVDMALSIARETAQGLAYAHTKTDPRGRPLGLVHRDVGPRNILLGWDGAVKLGDFGVAKAPDVMFSDEGSAIPGKDDYLSPEQASGAVTDARADLFSLGIVLSELLLGVNVFRGPNAWATRRAIATLPLPEFRQVRPDIDPGTDAFLRRTLRRDRDRRWASAAEVVAALDRIQRARGLVPDAALRAAYLRALAPQSPFRS